MKTQTLYDAQNGENIELGDLSSMSVLNRSSVERHTLHEWIFMEKNNTGQHIIDFERYRMQPMTLYLIHPNQVHLLKDIHKGEGMVVRFPSQFVSKSIQPFNAQWMQRIGKIRTITFSDSAYLTLRKKLLQLKASLNAQHPLEHYKSQHLFAYLFFEILAHIPREIHPQGEHDPANRFSKAVEFHFRQIRSVQEYANLLGIPLRKLTVEVEQKYGKSPQDIIQETLLLEIKKLLATMPHQHEEIADQLGFDTLQSYSDFVLENEGILPYRLSEQIDLYSA